MLKVSPDGMPVLRLHYSADPDKDPAGEKGRAWLEQKRKEFTNEAIYRQELEIDYGAKRGQLVFPEFDRNVHCVDPSGIPQQLTIYCAIDPHPRTPHGILWLGVDQWDDCWVFRELWPSRVYGTPKNLRDTDEDNRYTTKEYVEIIAMLEGNSIEWRDPETDNEHGIYHEATNGEKIVERFMDQAGKGFRARGGDGTPELSIADVYHNYGISCRDPIKSIETGEDAIRELLKPRQHNVFGTWPRIHFSTDCPEIVLEMEKWRYKSRNRQLEELELWQEGVKARRHLIDCLRYLLTADLGWIARLASRRNDYARNTSLGMS